MSTAWLTSSTDIPLDVFVQDIGEYGFYLSSVDQVICLMVKSMVADHDEKLRSLQAHFGENVSLFCNRIIPCIREIPPEEMRRLIQLFFPIQGKSASYFALAPSVIGPNVPHQFVHQPAHRSSAFSFAYYQQNPAAIGHPYPSTPACASASSSAQTPDLPIAGPNSSVEAPHLSTAESRFPVESPPSWSAPVSNAGPCDTAAPTPTSRLLAGFTPPTRAKRVPAPRSRKKKIQWSNKQSAFVVYYLGNGYLLSQVQRMFRTEFEGTAPTIKDIREYLEMIDSDGAREMTRSDLIGEVAQGRIQFKAQREKIPVPSPRSAKEEVQTPLRMQHKRLVTFFQEIALDRALVHELFELHFDRTITEEQLDEMWKRPVGGQGIKRLLVEAYQEGLFKYLEEGQLGHVDCREVQKNISRAQAKIRVFKKKESITKAFRAIEGRERRGAVDDSDKEETGDKDQEPNELEGAQDEFAEEEPNGGKKKKPNVKDKRPPKDREAKFAEGKS